MCRRESKRTRERNTLDEKEQEHARHRTREAASSSTEAPAETHHKCYSAFICTTQPSRVTSGAWRIPVEDYVCCIGEEQM